MSRPGDIAAISARRCRADREHRRGDQGAHRSQEEVYLEAKGNGFDVKILREVIRVRKQDQQERDELETLLEVYLQAIKGAPPVAGCGKGCGKGC